MKRLELPEPLEPPERPERVEAPTQPRTQVEAADRLRRKYDRLDPPGARALHDPCQLSRSLANERVDALRQLEIAEPSFHVVSRHLDRSTADLDSRLTNQEWLTHATTFTTNEALVMAEMRMRREAHSAKDDFLARPDIGIELPIADVLGPNWRRYVRGRSRTGSGFCDAQFPDDTVIFARWDRTSDGDLQPYTLYPKIPIR